MNKLYYPGWACALALMVCFSVNAQTPLEPPPPPRAPDVPPLAIPLPVLYRAFFAHVQSLEVEADKAQQRGEIRKSSGTTTATC